MPRILIIEDEPQMRWILTANLGRAGYEVAEAASVSEGKARIFADHFDAVLVDQSLPDGEGLNVVSSAHSFDSTLSVVMLTAAASIELAVAAIRQGAFEFLAKPFEPDVLLSITQRACEHTTLLRENLRLRREVEKLEGSGEICGSSPGMKAVRAIIARVAPTQATVLITGETGTGKELVARAIHNQSPRASKPFMPVNCAAFTESLLESELFGHEKGAFTGADRIRQGLFEAANGGTLFLDEIGEMSLTAQARLLRVLTDGHIVRVGSTRLIRVDVRVLVATHRDLPAMIAEGRFRQDLYYRLAVVPITIPPLRERAEDIPVLCEWLSRQVALELKVPQRHCAPDAVCCLRNYTFPGNVRELRNLIERAYILSRGESLDHGCLRAFGGADAASQRPSSANCATCPALKGLPEDFQISTFLEEVEQAVIANMLAATDGAQAEAARRLGLSRSVLSYKLAKYGFRGAGPKR